jgi:hypothetical protein
MIKPGREIPELLELNKRTIKFLLRSMYSITNNKREPNRPQKKPIKIILNKSSRDILLRIK